MTGSDVMLAWAFGLAPENCFPQPLDNVSDVQCSTVWVTANYGRFYTSIGWLVYETLTNDKKLHVLFYLYT